MPSVGSSTVPLTTILALLRTPSWALATGGSQTAAGPAAVGPTSRSSTARCLVASCAAYAVPSQVHDRQRPASKWEQSMADPGYGAPHSALV